jgi:hypothetical protein
VVLVRFHFETGAEVGVEVVRVEVVGVEVVRVEVVAVAEVALSGMVRGVPAAGRIGVRSAGVKVCWENCCERLLLTEVLIAVKLPSLWLR